ncbi:hypothetical protein HELRODRAFT_176847 [Helobdella robusta]|uniref:S1 motif domain-containing protein n=1 Tax=Helobdella robusta TaxID=6412 RepID=T1FAY9_HELRO|nr:hypothetical protein HELRODRAFT_176847 [Helobdella robusta]ESN98387.1 hypothetical protein HELRODRAFT_176847 [Helobdella robusta]
MNFGNSCHVLNIKERISVSPEHMRKEKAGIDVRAAVEHVYGRQLMSFSNKFRGVPLSYKNVKCFCRRAPMMDDDYQIYLDIQLELTVFRPRLGDILEGVVNKLSPGGRHVGLLAHDFFNISAVNNNWNEEEIEVGQVRRVRITGITSHRSTLQIRGNLLPGFAVTTTADDVGGAGGCEKKKKKKSKHKSPNKSDQLEDTITLEIDTESVLNGSSGAVPKKKKKKKNKVDDDGGDVQVDGGCEVNISRTDARSPTNSVILVDESPESHHDSFKVPKPLKRRNESFAGLQENEFSPEVNKKKKKKRMSCLT